jgi:hypothetical protein
MEPRNILATHCRRVTKSLCFVVAAPLLLTACASIQPQQFVGPSGKVGYSMRCSGMGRTLEACYQKAGEMCPRGYSIVERGSSVASIPQANNTPLITTRESLVVECK